MLETILTHLCNWFPAEGGRHAGTFAITGGAPAVSFLLPGQYYRVRGSVFSDGLHRFGDGETLAEETFNGEIWALAIPKAIIDLSEEIAQWRKSNPDTDKTSESFGGYSYTRSGTSSGGVAGWQSVFAARLNAYRRVCDG